MSFHERFLVLAGLLVATAPSVASAQVPNTDIWIADVRYDGHEVRIENPVNVTNRPGYDNQPAFLDRVRVHSTGRHTRSDLRNAERLSEFLCTSADSLGSTDIFRWDPYQKKAVQITHTAESEYSPAPFFTKSGDPAGFCCVRVEADSAQRLWRFDLDGSNPRLVLADVDSIGYFAWIDERHVAVFVLGNETRKEPHTLRVVDVETQGETIVARDIGRAIHRIPGSRDISFTLREPDDTYRFLLLREGRAAGEPLIRATLTGQDAAWLGNTMLLMTAGTTIYVTTPFPEKGNDNTPGVWRAVSDFADHGIGAITRMAVTPDWRKIAFVATMAGP